MSNGIHLLDADGDHCRFPAWQDTCTLIVCGKSGYPWCDEHRAIVFERKRERRRHEEQQAELLEKAREATWQNVLLKGSR
jgi:hypothetical protein